MVILKIWLGALAALVLFLCLQALLQEHAERLERTPVVHRA
ncbi:hypothetical protein [Burkholderia sp. LMG 13014]|nr:hypothetical protein [Burkholderia sp. LMG 13014]